MIDEDAPKIYGLDTVDKGATVYITEGPFDSTFLCNSIAMCGADLVLIVTGGLAIAAGSLIMNQGVEKLQEGSAVSLTKEKRLSSGLVT